MKNPTIKRCVIYTRVATSEQRPDGTSLDAQRESLTRWAAAAGVPVVACVEEVASGAAGARRVELERLLGAVCPGDVVAVSQLDRLTRDPRAATRTVRRILRVGARCVSVAEGEFDGSPAAEHRLSMLASVAGKG
jgi:DNA invertase Pin-like site-specific DNA recombinase